MTVLLLIYKPTGAVLGAYSNQVALARARRDRRVNPLDLTVQELPIWDY